MLGFLFMIKHKCCMHHVIVVKVLFSKQFHKVTTRGPDYRFHKTVNADDPEMPPGHFRAGTGYRLMFVICATGSYVAKFCEGSILRHLRTAGMKPFNYPHSLGGEGLANSDKLCFIYVCMHTWIGECECDSISEAPSRDQRRSH